ncbi:MAG: LacI family DNA-binding transcriptional regulator [Kiritimatiellae bacterium]|nr:LacI family DNA-binding transcriptional regulator [Kiritimatiellia bacterium]
MSVTLKILAKKASVSPATVSLALHDDPRVAAATRKRVQKLARRLDYVPSNLGRALQAKRSRLVGYLSGNVTASFYNDILQGIVDTLSPAGYGLLVATVGDEADGLRQLAMFREKCVDGIIISDYKPALLTEVLKLTESGLPVVGASMESPHSDIPSVVIDNPRGGEMAAEHLLALGHERLAYCFGSRSSQPRYQGCLRATARHGVAEPPLCATRDALRRLLETPQPPTAIVAFSDLHALDVKHAAESLGLAIPRDLSVVGFDDLWFAALPEFQLTTVRQPKRRIGELAAGMLVNRMRGGAVASQKLQPEIITRNSTAAPPIRE